MPCKISIAAVQSAICRFALVRLDPRKSCPVDGCGWANAAWVDGKTAALLLKAWAKLRFVSWPKGTHRQVAVAIFPHFALPPGATECCTECFKNVVCCLVRVAVLACCVVQHINV
jgi:hypothetical protein